MATNTPAKHPNVHRLSVPANTEVTFNFPGVVTIIDFSIKTIEQVDVRISFDAGGTFSGDNYVLLESGDAWSQIDINWTHGTQMWFRSEAGTVTVQIIYWG